MHAFSLPISNQHDGIARKSTAVIRDQSSDNIAQCPVLFQPAVNSVTVLRLHISESGLLTLQLWLLYFFFLGSIHVPFESRD